MAPTTRSIDTMIWFRLYNNLRHDPKVQNLRPELFRFWINLLCMASDQDERGVIPSAEAVATDLGMRRDFVDRFISSLVASKLLVRGDKEELRIHGWTGRQPTSDDVGVRVKKHRAKGSGKREASKSDDVKRYTGPPCNVIDSDSDKEEENTPPNPPRGEGVGEGIPRPDSLPKIPDRAPGLDPRPPRVLPGKPAPATVEDVVGLARASLGDRCEIEDYQTHVEGWLYSSPIEWVRDAIVCTAATAKTIGPGFLAQYTAGCLRRWHPNGPPRNEVEPARKKFGAQSPAPAYRIVQAAPDDIFAQDDRNVIRKAAL